jgi:hypothetical protein
MTVVLDNLFEHCLTSAICIHGFAWTWLAELGGLLLALIRDPTDSRPPRYSSRRWMRLAVSLMGLQYQAFRHAVIRAGSPLR